MSGITIKTIMCTLLLGLFTSPNAIAGTYKWTDEDGNVVYSQHPPPSGQYQSIRVKPTPRSASSPSRAADQSKQFLEQATKKRKNDAKLNEEVTKAREMRQKNCATAKKQLQFYTIYRRKKNDKGEFVRITDTEKEAGMKEAKQAIKDFCD